ncbi:MAG: hypothetical protein LBB49_06800 [Gracilibacteraceae bacterium]|jgi:RNA polymerase sigma factor|nr:hypothetical protein [Gracilibacteraceae bacterium]
MKRQDLNKLALSAAKAPWEFERLLAEFRPFLWSRVSRFAGNSPDIRDEMMTAAMQAFHEAVTNYNPDQGHFFPFLEMVVKMRLIDSRRRFRSRQVATIPLETEKDDGTAASDPLVEVSLKAFQAGLNRQDLASEIESLKRELAEWDITIDSLVKHSPKQEKTREAYKKIVREIADHDEIVQILWTKRYYPVKKIAVLTKLPHKTIERSRIFVIASLIILRGEYACLRSYVTME